MKINSPFTKAACATLTTVVAILSPLPCYAQSILGFPLVSFRIKIVDEKDVCNLPDGYDSIVKDVVKCPTLEFKYVENLPGAEIKTTPSPPNQEIQVSKPDDDSNNIFAILDVYRHDFKKAVEKGQKLLLDDRKSVVFIFDFGESHEEFDITIQGFQPNLILPNIDPNQPIKAQGCEDSKITKEEKWVYPPYTLPANHSIFFYHQKADFAIPCSNVKWQLTAKGKVSKQTYTWIFNTAL
jgi:hypothetical protein